MIDKRFLLLCCVALFQIACNDKANQSEWTMVWSDEFEVAGLPDTNKWTYLLGDGCPTLCGWGNDEKEYYTQDSSNVKVVDGHLIITAMQDTSKVNGFSSAKLSSEHKGDWKYGKLEVRAKLPVGRGTWPAIWMLPTDSKYKGWPASGEIDVMEHVGYEPDSIYGTVHTTAYNHINGTQKGFRSYRPNCESEFLIYGLEWNEDEMKFFVNDENFFTFHNEHKTSDEWPFDQDFHLILNLAVGGAWGGKKGIDTTIFPQSMLVDYVRVYQKTKTKE